MKIIITGYKNAFFSVLFFNVGISQEEIQINELISGNSKGDGELKIKSNERLILLNFTTIE